QPLDQCHSAGTCTNGVCSNPNKSDGSACNDSNACTQSDICQQGVCIGANPVQCSALDACHDPGTCNPNTGTCTNPNKMDGAACSDNNACTNMDACKGGVCTPGSPVMCPPADQCHLAGVCDTTTGMCSNTPVPDGTACNDGDV